VVACTISAVSHRSSSRLCAGAPTALIAALVLAVGLSACGATAGPTETNNQAAAAAAAAAPQTTVDAGPTSQVAKAKGDSVKVYSSPDSTTPVRSDPNPWLYNNEPGAKIPLVYLVKDAAGPDWLEVYLSTRPNGSTGFVKRSDVEIQDNPYRLEVHLGAFNLKAYKGNTLVLDAPIAVGADDGPTPGGLYFVNVLLKSTDPGYGPYAFGLSGHSDVYQSFNGGDGQLGLHGTDQPEKIGTKVSHGCIRLKNEDITTLAQQLPLGTPIQILA
jgi:lipoprotein-anchoring transpeptidase ErfK/SrfK